MLLGLVGCAHRGKAAEGDAEPAAIVLPMQWNATLASDPERVHLHMRRFLSIGVGVLPWVPGIDYAPCEIAELRAGLVAAEHRLVYDGGGRLSEQRTVEHHPADPGGISSVMAGPGGVESIMTGPTRAYDSRTTFRITRDEAGRILRRSRLLRARDFTDYEWEGEHLVALSIVEKRVPLHYDAQGRLVRIGPPPSGLGGIGDVTLRYDASERLVERRWAFSSRDVPWVAERFDWDAGTIQTVVHWTQHGHPRDAVTTRALAYDEEGRLVRIGDMTVDYDRLGRPTIVEEGRSRRRLYRYGCPPEAKAPAETP